MTSNRTRFRIAVGGLAGVAAVLAVLGSGALAGRASGPVVCASTGASSSDPLVTAIRFLSAEIDRRQPGRAYSLVTRSYRNGADCKAFVRRRIDGGSFGRVDWSRSTYDVVASGTGQVVMQVVLFGVGTNASIAAFWMELQQDGPTKPWQVGLWRQKRLSAVELHPVALRV
jgi:hypothetical protein